jgi:hypothetical protein
VRVLESACPASPRTPARSTAGVQQSRRAWPTGPIALRAIRRPAVWTESATVETLVVTSPPGPLAQQNPVPTRRRRAATHPPAAVMERVCVCPQRLAPAVGPIAAAGRSARRLAPDRRTARQPPIARGLRALQRKPMAAFAQGLSSVQQALAAVDVVRPGACVRSLVPPI